MQFGKTSNIVWLFFYAEYILLGQLQVDTKVMQKKNGVILNWERYSMFMPAVFPVFLINICRTMKELEYFQINICKIIYLLIHISCF